jgi:hypothetical protein
VSIPTFLLVRSYLIILRGDIYAYWSEDIGDYGINNNAEEAGIGPGGFCDTGPDVDMFALTIGNMLLDSVTLCPDAFTDQAELHETIAEGMGSEDATHNKGGVALVRTSPRSLTLFHELIHMTSGTDTTPNVGSTLF